VDVLVDEADLRFVQTLGVPISIISTPEVPGPGVTAIDANLGLYHTYAEMESVMNWLETTYPTLADRSVMGRASRAGTSTSSRSRTTSRSTKTNPKCSTWETTTPASS